MELTEKLSGWFDVREFKENTPREQQRMKADDQNITFSATFDQCPQALAEFAKQYTDANGNSKWRVSFKISPKCRWFDGNAQPVDRPTNLELDGQRFEVRVQYNTLRPAPNAGDKAARGYWANCIQFERVNDNPFEAFAPQPMMSQQQPQVAQPQQQQQQPQQQSQQQYNGYQPQMPPPLGGQMPRYDGNPFDGGEPNLPY